MLILGVAFINVINLFFIAQKLLIQYELYFDLIKQSILYLLSPAIPTFILLGTSQ